MDSPPPLIGAIVQALERALEDARPPELRRKRLEVGSFDLVPSLQIWEAFDRKFHNWLDYRFWRQAVRPHFSSRGPWFYARPTAISEGWEDLASTASRVSESKSIEVVWGAIGFAPEIVEKALRRNAGAEYRFVPEFI